MISLNKAIVSSTSRNQVCVGVCVGVYVGLWIKHSKLLKHTEMFIIGDLQESLLGFEFFIWHIKYYDPYKFLHGFKLLK